MGELQLTNDAQIVDASAEKPVKLKALSAGVEVRGVGIPEGETVELTLPTAVAGFGVIEYTVPSTQPKPKPVSKKKSSNAANGKSKAKVKKNTTKAKAKKTRSKKK